MQRPRNDVSDIPALPESGAVVVSLRRARLTHTRIGSDWNRLVTKTCRLRERILDTVTTGISGIPWGRLGFFSGRCGAIVHVTRQSPRQAVRGPHAQDFIGCRLHSPSV
jgi:hypothetical protein